ncbi:MAG: choice-of-anchor J domain-containing protein [Bacteroidetes bacterium]|nr:choice-of-anchor J domain-containing protein [Bacteroidota bacterium]
MRKITTLFTAAIFGACATSDAQVKLQENFESATIPALPAGWIQTTAATTGWKTNSGAVVSQSPWTCPAHTQYAFIDDWNNDENNNPSTLTSPVFNLTGVTTPYLSFDYYFVGGVYNSTGKKETCIVQITTNGGANWTNIDTLKGNSTMWQTHYVNLTAYAGANNVQLAIKYTDDGTKLPGVGIDNIKVYVPAANDAALTAVTPVAGSPTDYAVTNANLTLGGTIFNKGASTITSIIVKYQQGANPAVSNTVSSVSIAPFTSYTFTCSNPYTMPGSLGDYPIKMWVELPGDADNTNDTMNTSVTAVSFNPTKKIFVEEGTGTWCGFCPRGAVYMDSLANNYASHFSLVAVHNNDPMEVAAYDAFVGTKIGGYPDVIVDRRDVLDPSALIDVYNQQKDYFGFADITITDMGASSFDFSVKASVKPALNLSGDYRLALVLAEDNVRGGPDGSTWDQHNYYSSHNYGPLNGAGHNWYNEPSVVPASQMSYNFVARMIVPTPTGAASSLPSTMTAGTTYDYIFPAFTVPQPYNRANMKAIVILLRNSDGAVLNSQNITMPLGVTNVDAGVQHLSVYPNPANDNTTLAFTLTEKSSVGLQVLDAVGRVVNTVNAVQYEKGTQHISINTADLATGLYTIKLQTEKGTMTQQLSVVK